MPILQKIASNKNLQFIVLNRFSQSIICDNESIFKEIIGHQTAQSEDNLEYLGKGSYGIVIRDTTTNILYKCMKIYENNEYNKRKFRKTRQMFPMEQEMHEYTVAHDSTITCNIYEPLLFGPLIILKMQFLDKYIGLNVMRKDMEHTPQYFARMCPIVSQIIKHTRSLSAMGIFHGDHKDNNILVHPDTLDVRVIDFGKSILLKDVQNENLKCIDNVLDLQENQIPSRTIEAYQNYHYSSVLQYIFDEYHHKQYFKLFQLIDYHSVFLTIAHLANFDKNHAFPFIRQKLGSQFRDRQDDELFLFQQSVQFRAKQSNVVQQQPVEVLSYYPFERDVPYYSPSDLSDMSQYCQINVEFIEVPKFFKFFMRVRKSTVYLTVYILDVLNKRPPIKNIREHFSKFKSEELVDKIMELNMFDQVAQLLQE